MHRIVVDFNTMMSEPVDIVKLGVEGINDLPSLAEGERVLLTDGEMEVEGTIVYIPERHYWMARPDDATWRDLPLPSGDTAEAHTS